MRAVGGNHGGSYLASWFLTPFWVLSHNVRKGQFRDDLRVFLNNLFIHNEGSVYSEISNLGRRYTVEEEY